MQKKRPMGRPKKDPLEKGEQFSIRLGTARKMELELLARDLGVSLSQAVDYAIKQLGSTHLIDGVPLGDAAQRGLSQLQQLLLRGLPVPSGKAIDIVFLALAHGLAKRSPAAFRALTVPESLRTDEEVFFIQAVEALHRSDEGRKVLAAYIGASPPANLDDLFSEARQAMAIGVDAETLVEFKLNSDDPFNGLNTEPYEGDL
ncbi:hypothetical protein CAL19_02070 [Bordetella genomosp. 7]|uniref:Uncharacterized protein n=2 Tax=Bordetella genomosp. 7 TaxID=1416805 RepID=A0A261RR50_9BORD|nr:hypothetical protein CAL19_02070 [Bordetella genomosp. 7]